LLTAYCELEKLIHSFSVSQVLPFDQSAAEIAEQLKLQKIRIGTLDMRIASIALSQNATLRKKNLLVKMSVLRNMKRGLVTNGSNTR
jgi:tRNA(fMet)-specific endonuclease VapC